MKSLLEISSSSLNAKSLALLGSVLNIRKYAQVRVGSSLGQAYPDGNLMTPKQYC